MELSRNALLKGLEAADDANVESACVGCPKYSVVVNASEYKEAEQVMKRVCSSAIDNRVSSGGGAVLKRESK